MVISSIIASKDLAEALSYWATFGGIVAALLAAMSYYVDRRHSDWNRSGDLYLSFLDSALAYPEFYAGCWSDGLKDDSKLRTQYSYFVGKAFWTFEQILGGEGYDSEWRDCFKVIMREHRDFISSEFFVRERPGYDKRLLEIVDEVIAEVPTKDHRDA